MDLFREMRRKNQEMSQERCEELLKKGTSGVLALLGDGGYPYAVPISYVYDNQTIYFHGSRTGHKMDAIRNCPKASFCVIGQDQVVPEKYTTCFRSVIAFGQMRELSGDQARAALERLGLRYYPGDSASNRCQTIEKSLGAMAVFALSIEHMTGKEAKELLSP